MPTIKEAASELLANKRVAGPARGHAVERVDRATRRDELGDSFLFVRPEYKISREMGDLQAFFYSGNGPRFGP